MAQAPRDQNRIPTLLGVDSVLFTTPTTVAVDATTHELLVQANISSGLDLPVYDYVSMALSAGDTTETYTFKTGGSGGSTVATVVVVYTTSTRDVLSTVTKT